MDKKLLDFLAGNTNAIRLEVIVVRETTPTGTQFITIKQFDGDREIYSFWHNPRKDAKGKSPPKHTGGKQPYVMLMINEVEELKKKGVANVEELIGHLVCLGKYIEWNTGRLIHKRNKTPLRYKDLQGIYGCGNRKLNNMLNDMREHDLLFSTEEGYFISSRFIKKGKTNNKEGN